MKKQKLLTCILLFILLLFSSCVMPVVNTTQSGETNTTWDISTIDDMKTSSIDDPQCNTQEQPKTVVTTETEETGSKEPFTFVDEKLPNHNGASYNGRNGEMYGAIEYSFSLSFLTLEQYNFYFEIFRGTNVSCYGHFCEYFNISKEEYMAFWDDFKARWNAYNVRKQEDIDNRHNFEYVFDVERDYDEWFSPDYFNNPMFLYDKYVPSEIPDFFEYVPEDIIHTSTYYRIEHRLIEAVTLPLFETFLEKFNGKDRNIINFINYFGITRKQFDIIYSKENKKWGDLNLYNTDYLFGTKELQNLYFCKQDKQTFGK